MGFGSYDESEENEPEFAIGNGDEEHANLHANDHEGTISFESGASTGDLLDGLAGMTEDGREE